MDATPTHIGPYHLGEPLGQGDLATVYRAEDTLYERSVAIKVLHPHLAQDLHLARHFVSAGRETLRLRHPNIVRVHDAGQADGVFYIAMDLVEGTTLAARLAQQPGPLPAIEARAIVEQIATALDYAHRRGVVHHNLKPANVLLSGDGQVLVADFDGSPAAGHATDPDHPLFLRLKSPTYLAPEQARGDEQLPLDRRPQPFLHVYIDWLSLARVTTIASDG